MNSLYAVALGGALGSMGRYLVAGQVARVLGLGFPYGTLAVNVVGSFVIGLLAELFALRFQVTPEWRAFLIVGVLGGFTTFSSFALEIGLMIEKNAFASAFLYVAASLMLGVGALFAGMALVRTLS